MLRPYRTRADEDARRRFSQNLAPVGARKAPKPLLCLHFKFIQQTLFWSKRKMRKQTIQYTSSLDALIAVAKRLSVYENQHKMDSEDFYNQYNQGTLSDDIIFIEWANDYRHYLALRQELEQILNHAA